MLPNISLNRRMPNGTSGGVRGARFSSPYSIGYAPHTSNLLHPRKGCSRKLTRGTLGMGTDGHGINGPKTFVDSSSF